MASKSLFRAKAVGEADTTNQAGGLAYSMTAKEALAQLAVTGCFNQTFYAKAQDQLTRVKELATQCDPEFISKLAIYSREKGFLKDMPAFLTAHLTGRVAAACQRENALRQQRASLRTAQQAEPADLEAKILAAHAEVERLNALVRHTFLRVIDNGKMLKNFVQIVRSGEAGRKSLGSTPRNLIRSWLAARNDRDIFFQSIGSDPSLGDVVNLVHPRPETKERAAFFAYLLDKKEGRFEDKPFVVAESLPPVVLEYERFKLEPTGEIPRVPFEMVEGLPLSTAQWGELATRQSWQSLRQRLNTFLRKGAFADPQVVRAVCEKLTDREQIEKARALPYQLLVAYTNVSPEMPREITNALQDAMEVATRNVPVIDGLVVVLPDVSGSMHSPITGYQVNAKTGKAETHTSKVRCVDVAALVSASFLRANPQTIVIPFAETARSIRLNPKDSIMTNTEKLMKEPGGGTNCGAALAEVNRQGLRPALVMYVSDNESWMDSRYDNSEYYRTWGHKHTSVLTEWETLKQRCPEARLVCNDITPNESKQAPSRPDILNVGGFSDQIFEVVRQFYQGRTSNWIDMIEATT